jgi:hypothetical protein
MTANLFALSVPANRWRDDPASCAACVFDALVEMRLFDVGAEAWQNDVLNWAQSLRKCRSGYEHNPTHETLGRELRGRTDGSNRVTVHDYLLGCGVRVVLEKGKVKLVAAQGGKE